ncbi:dUTP diphosphatase [Lentibacillus saliphilus]|uniref:dUTP diphosphatase n=1 Tax=Lentibacillus saliphilus TaxID=2737028 RepID=UPI001C30F319|nr:dUTP diphosphatase [Lentibacillus saliphilus]
MNWSELYTMQKQLDTYIEKNHSLSNANLEKERMLALLVELGELANETRCFKFWSNKQPSGIETIQEEYVDGIHFLMSIGLDQGYEYHEEHVTTPTVDLTTQFNLVFSGCIYFNEAPTSQNYQKMFERYIELGKLLGIGETDIYNAYMAKNKTNYTRQQQGY